ncbi:MAG: outer membrane lipoprotein carrier protein LolA [Clostridia bacterium]|nr:outer membrane lipoprotein carrier protein LolA [Clostridia bacterium]
MKKSITALLCAAILMTSLSGCGAKTAHDSYKEIYKRYNDIQSFSATVEITADNRQTQNVYLAEQYYKAPDKFAMTVLQPQSVSGSGYVFEGGKVLVKSGFGHGEEFEGLSVSERSSVAISDFFAEYYKSEETFIQTDGKLAGDTTCMTCFLPGKNERRYMQSLWIDNKTYLPLKMITYDIKENPVVTVVFKEFERNCEIDQQKFE